MSGSRPFPNLQASSAGGVRLVCWEQISSADHLWARDLLVEGEMYGSREVGSGLLTVSVAVAASRIVDYGEGVAFSALTSGGGYLAAMCIYHLSGLSSTERSPAVERARLAVQGYGNVEGEAPR
jgi:hypothetical protein